MIWPSIRCSITCATTRLCAKMRTGGSVEVNIAVGTPHSVIADRRIPLEIGEHLLNSQSTLPQALASSYLVHRSPPPTREAAPPPPRATVLITLLSGSGDRVNRMAAPEADDHMCHLDTARMSASSSSGVPYVNGSEPRKTNIVARRVLDPPMRERRSADTIGAGAAITRAVECRA